MDTLSAQSPTLNLIECVPNFSEGRNIDTINAIAEAIASVEGVRVLHVDRGEAANRTVITFVGPADAVVEAAYRMVSPMRSLPTIRVVGNPVASRDGTRTRNLPFKLGVH